MGFPVSCAGLLPGLLMSAAISMAALKELWISVLKSLGLIHLQSEAMAFFDNDDDDEVDGDQLTDFHHDFVGLYHIAYWTRNCPSPHLYNNLQYNEALDVHNGHPSPSLISDPDPNYNNDIIYVDDDNEYTQHPTDNKNDDLFDIDEVESIDSGPCCCVCLCPLESNLDALPSFNICCLSPCGHSFHHHCITGWLRHGHSICPLCRASLSKGS